LTARISHDGGEDSDVVTETLDVMSPSVYVLIAGARGRLTMCSTLAPFRNMLGTEYSSIKTISIKYLSV
jgi:hypothetical protein